MMDLFGLWSLQGLPSSVVIGAGVVMAIASNRHLRIRRRFRPTSDRPAVPHPDSPHRTDTCATETRPPTFQTVVPMGNGDRPPSASGDAPASSPFSGTFPSAPATLDPSAPADADGGQTNGVDAAAKEAQLPDFRRQSSSTSAESISFKIQPTQTQASESQGHKKSHRTPSD